MTDYVVRWEIDITADSPEEAAKEARSIQQDHFSEAVRDNPHIYQANICKVCKKELQSTGGFHWKYAGHTTEK